MASIDDHDWQQNKSVLECNKFMFENQLHCDVTFTFKNRDSPKAYEQVDVPGSVENLRPIFISAHKYVLMSRSPTFYAKFTDGTKGSSCSIKVEDVEKAVFVKMLRFIYFEEVRFLTTDVCELLNCAIKCKVDELAIKCRRYIEEHVNPSNACLFLDQILGRGEKHLEDKCLQTIDAAPNEVFSSAYFPEMGKPSLKKILERDTLDAAEIDVFDACLTWAKAKCPWAKGKSVQPNDDNLRAVLGDALYYIRFPTMGMEEYTSKVATRKILSADEALETLLYLTKAKPTCEAPFLCNPRKRNKDEVIFSPVEVHYETNNSDTYVTFRDMPIRVSAIYFINPSDIKLEEITIGNSKSSQFSEVPGRTVAKHQLFEATFKRSIVLTPGEYAVSFSAPVDPHKLYPALDYDDNLYGFKERPIFPSYNYGHFLVGFKYKVQSQTTQEPRHKGVKLTHSTRQMVSHT